MTYISYDIGTKTLKTLIGSNLDDAKHILQEHYSDPLQTIRKIEQEHQIDLKKTIRGIVTGRYRNVLSDDPRFLPIDWTIPVVWYTNQYHKDIQYIIDIGATTLSLLEIRNGKFHRFQTNSLCASGTGSFLDQQMIRMDLSIKDIKDIQPTKRVPTIASRCAVFAKSDLIHRQQEGYSIEELWNGLVKGMAESCYVTLLRGASSLGKILLIGGLVKNRLFYHYFSNLLESEMLKVPEQPETYIANCGYHFLHSRKDLGYLERLNNSRTIPAYEKKLDFKINKNNENLAQKRIFDRHGNEINVDKFVNDQAISVYFGLDIGSTSTKGVLRDTVNGDILFNIYRKTAGNPISAYQKLLKGIRDYQKQHDLDLQVKGMGTTGSGRKIVGSFAGADLVINEITAHLKGALREYPDVRTIFEIGGQDSKYILVEDKWMKDANMNYVCAAGTGSFLEEQAQVLNISLDDFEKLSSGVTAPKMNDRCTVFMEMDAQKLVVDGHSKQEVVTSLLHAVCRNYLHRVVQNRPIEEPILFLGATARNRGLVEAFSNLLGKKIYTSKHSHIMGALGMTELLKDQKGNSDTSFKGLQLDEKKVDFRERVCTLCQNRCLIMYFETEGSSVSWGHKCGKETKETGSVKDYRKYFLKSGKTDERDVPLTRNKLPEKQNLNKIIYVPKALFYYSHGHLWHNFLSKLGFIIQNSPDSTREIIDLGLKYSPNELCYPMKLAIGHVIHLLLNKQTPVFLPYVIRDTPNEKTTNSYFCVITQSLPAIVRNIVKHNNLSDEGLLSPVIDLSDSDTENIKRIHKYFLDEYKFSKQEVKKAFQKAKDAHFDYLARQLLKSEETCREMTVSEKPVLVIMGRSYNLYDESLNLTLVKDTAKYGYTLLPYDFVPATRKDIPPYYNNMYWSYGQKFLAVAEKLNKFPNFYPVFLTNFNCGPDSFLLSMIEDMWPDKPFLILELDEHSGNAGYLTRIEAFLDRIRDYQNKTKVSKQLTTNKKGIAQLPPPNKRLLFPPMHPFGTKLFAAAFRAHGYNAIPLEKEDQETFQKGKACLRGSECLPAASTLGTFLHYYEREKKEDLNNTALFMPCAAGPCRFGQYGIIQQMVLKRLGIDVEVFSLSSENNYGGISERLRILIVKAVVVTDILIKLGCKLRPLSDSPAAIDQIIMKYIELFVNRIESEKSLTKLFSSLHNELTDLNISMKKNIPLIGIVGEIYVRCSPFSNDNVVKKVEDYGAEAWVAPFMEWFHYTTWLKRNKNDSLLDVLKARITSEIIFYYEKKYYRLFGHMLSDRREPLTQEIALKAKPYISKSIRGEAILTIGKTIDFIEKGAKLIINVAPFSCMPGTIGSIVLTRISEKYSVPIISLYYDGFTNFDLQLEHYLNNLQHDQGSNVNLIR